MQVPVSSAAAVRGPGATSGSRYCNVATFGSTAARSTNGQPLSGRRRP